MITSKNCFKIIILVTIAAAAIRLPLLNLRPMHTDEAVHGIKFGQLLEKGEYKYDAIDYHGPTLNYLTLIPAWLSGAENITEVSESTLRIVPVFFGIMLVSLLLLITDGIGLKATIFAAILMAFSPAMVYYSRYYIQEMLLVFFTFSAIACSYRYTQSQNKKIHWAILTGLSVGLMHATKETCIIAFGALLLALLITAIFQRSKPNGIKPLHVIVMLITAFAVSALFYSSFFKNPAGILDSYQTYATYFSRAGENLIHNKPWHYYFDILTWVEGFEKITWNEDLIVVAGAFGFIIAMTKKYRASFFVRFLAIYTLIMTVIYCAIPYKTPWSMLGFFHSMILLAAIAIEDLLNISKSRRGRNILYFFLIILGLILPLGQSIFLNFKYHTDTANPYVYAHTTNDIFKITNQIEDISLIHPKGKDMYIQVICPEDDYWPLPWYLRSFKNVGWWNTIDANTPAAKIIIASPEIEKALIKNIYERSTPGNKSLYVPLFESYMQLRPQVELRGYVTKELLDKYQQSKLND